jgi:hypothetical protein
MAPSSTMPSTTSFHDGAPPVKGLVDPPLGVAHPASSLVGQPFLRARIQCERWSGSISSVGERAGGGGGLRNGHAGGLCFFLFF